MNSVLALLFAAFGAVPLGLGSLATSQPVPVHDEPPPSMTVDDALDRALVELRTAEARGPGSAQAFKQARELVGYALEHDKFNQRALYYKARIFILADRGADALGTIQKWADSPQGQADWEAHFLLGSLYNAGGYHKLVKPELRKALSLNPREPRIYSELARCEMHLSNPRAAVQYARQVVTMLGDDATAVDYNLLAKALLANHQLDEADQQALLAIDRASAALRNTGSSVALLNRLRDSFKLALEVKQAELDANPTRVELYREISHIIQERAKVSLQMRDYEALGWCQRGLTAAGDHAPASLMLEAIRLYTRLGLTEEARALTTRMMKLFPDNGQARDIHQSLAGAKQGSKAPVEVDQVP